MESQSTKNLAALTTLDLLKVDLRATINGMISSPPELLSDEQYKAGFDVFTRGVGWGNYENFIIPQLSSLMEALSKSCSNIAVLEIGPGPKTVLEYLPSSMRSKIVKYSAFEPNILFATSLEHSLLNGPSPLPSLEYLPNIRREPFDPRHVAYKDGQSDEKQFNIILFCHSMYGMSPKREYVDCALKMLVGKPSCGIVAIFHRQTNLAFDGLICHHTASFPIGVTGVEDNDKELDHFAPFVAGFAVQNMGVHEQVQRLWRERCRTLGRKMPGNILLFQSPEVMIAFSKHATALPNLKAHVPLAYEARVIKNPEARLYNDINIVKPTTIEDVQQCVRWALKHQLGLTVLGGGHSGHCLWPHVVSVDMSAFNQTHVTTVTDERPEAYPNTLVVAGGGCKTIDILQATIATGHTIPLGSRPSVGAGLWLQGGFGHLARKYGLSCDAIVGAVLVDVSHGRVNCVGQVPEQHRPKGSIFPENSGDLLWAIKGAGTNFGIVVSVVFTASLALTHSVWNWDLPLGNSTEAQLKLKEFDEQVA